MAAQESTEQGAAKMEFKVTFCHNCDGGEQEYNIVASTIKSMFPQATVIYNRVNEYPIVVKIEFNGVEVWKGDQRGLFRKYKHRALPEIKAKLEALKI